MRRAIVFAPLARLEFEDAAAWYEEQRAGLGEELRIEVNATLQQVQKCPERFRRASPSTRQIRLKRFHKYSSYYLIGPKVINVIAVFHSSRNPQALLSRLK